jgi:hypothetical protein
MLQIQQNLVLVKALTHRLFIGKDLRRLLSAENVCSKKVYKTVMFSVGSILVCEMWECRRLHSVLNGFR